MSNMNADITDLVRPFAGSHAVERVTLGIEWKGELTSQVMQRLSKLLDDSEHPFSRKLEIHAKELAGSKDAPLSMPTPEEIDLVGLVLKSSADDEDGESDLVNELAIRKEGVFITVAKDYEGWKQTKALVLPLVESILLELAEEVTIEAIGLQYVDAFWLVDDVDFERIFDRSNENLPSRAFRNDHYWHVEVGFFNFPDEHFKNLLTSLQISYSPTEEEGSDEDKLSISCLTRTFINSTDDVEPVAVLALYDEIYKSNKSTFRDLMSSELCELIGLGDKTEVPS